MRACAIGVSVLFASASFAQANVTFSFASDTQSMQSTFSGGGVLLRQDGVDGARLELLADDANGPLPTISFDTIFFADLTLDFVDSVSLPGGSLTRVYEVNGTFGFNDADTGQPLLEAVVSTGSLSSLGTDDRWGSSASIEASSVIDKTTSYTWLGDSIPAYNLFQGAESSFADASFTLTNILDSLGVPGVELRGSSQLPQGSWTSEGSYSGSAFFIPTPASGVLLAAAGAVATRRRR
ncbi:MAG: hypothetical protein AAFN41_02825 [Planctomycetota bacterium]